MSEAFRVAITTDADVVTARQQARSMGGELGFTSTDLTLLATAISEVARNITAYAGEGEVAAARRPRRERPRGHRGDRRSDEGPGIAERRARAPGRLHDRAAASGSGCPARAGWWTSSSSQTAPGEGTTVRLVKWGRDGG